MTAVLLPNGKQQYFTTPGVPAVGYKLATFDAGTSNPRTTWADALKVGANTNPIILDARGEAIIFWDGAYKAQLQDSTGAVIWTVDGLQSLQNSFSVSLVPAVTNTVDLGSITLSWRNLYLGANNVPVLDTVTGNLGYYPRTAAEVAAAVIPANFSYAPGHLYRYGTNTAPGVTDMTGACNAWLSVGGNLFMPLADIVLVSGTLTMVSNSSITIAEGATFKAVTAGFSIFKATGKSNITLRGGTIQQTANNATVHFAAIELNTCTYCTVINVEIIGAQYTGVLLDTTSQSRVEGCYIHNSLGCTTADVDTADISVYKASNLNVIANNVCYGGVAVEHGIMLQDPGGSLLPLKNLVDGNRVGPHKSYGILNYLIDHNNTFCQIVNNEVEGITGTAQGGTTGCGIYNQGAGGTIIANNTVRNCCISTTAATLTPAGIGLNLDAAFEPVTVIGNTILDMAQFYGIEVVTGPANIIGNTVKFSAGVTANIGIYANLANNVTITGNHVSIDTSIAGGTGIFVFANGGNVSNIILGNNYILGCSSRGLRVDTTGAPTITNIVINGNNVTGGSAASIPLSVGNLIQGAITGNLAISTTVQAFDLNACVQTRITGNTFLTTGALAVNIAGTSSFSYYDKSNYQNTGIKNAATGLICEQLASATPGAGLNSAVGDRIEQSIPVVGNPKGWRCTVAGNPGTWVSEGNL